MAAVFAFGKRGANNSAPVSNYLISKGFDFDGVKVGSRSRSQLPEVGSGLMSTSFLGSFLGSELYSMRLSAWFVGRSGRI